MTDALARMMAAISALLLVAALGLLYATSRHPAGAQAMVVEFRNAFPLVEGMNVRVDGVVVGEVSRLEIDGRGLADATLALDGGAPSPRADATAAVRQEDPGAESYVDLEPGNARAPLPVRDGKPTIVCAAAPYEPCERSIVAPRLDDLLNTLDDPTRAGVKLLLGQLSTALDRRGVDINDAVLQIRPAVIAANRTLTEVNRQRTALKRLITAAEDVTGQASSRRRRLARLIRSLAVALDAPASNTKSLNTGLEQLPETLTRARATLTSLRRAAGAATPLAQELGRGAPDLAKVVGSAPDFLDDVAAFSRNARPTVDLTSAVFRSARPTTDAAADRLVTGAFDLAPAVARLVTSLFGDQDTVRLLLGKLASVFVEPGNQPGFPASYADRTFGRAVGKLNCELFGVPVRPGCLQDALEALVPGQRRRATSNGRARRPVVPRPAAPTRLPRPDAIARKPDKLADEVTDAIKQTLDDVLGPRTPPAGLGDGDGGELLDFLLGP